MRLARCCDDQAFRRPAKMPRKTSARAGLRHFAGAPDSASQRCSGPYIAIRFRSGDTAATTEAGVSDRRGDDRDLRLTIGVPDLQFVGVRARSLFAVRQERRMAQRRHARHPCRSRARRLPRIPDRGCRSRLRPTIHRLSGENDRLGRPVHLLAERASRAPPGVPFQIADRLVAADRDQHAVRRQKRTPARNRPRHARAAPIAPRHQSMASCQRRTVSSLRIAVATRSPSGRASDRATPSFRSKAGRDAFHWASRSATVKTKFQLGIRAQAVCRRARWLTLSRPAASRQR